MTSQSARTIDASETPTPADTMQQWLKAETQENHERAENTEFMKRVVDNKVTKEMYRFYLCNLYFVYKAIEEESEKHKDLPSVGAVWLQTELSRVSALEEDLEFYYGPNWRELIRCTESSLKYASRVYVLSESDPHLLVAHSYSRYLGDLSGGQIIKRKIQKAFDLQGDDGVRFYCFDEITDVKKFKEYYTSRMNAMDVDLDVKQRIKDEAVETFQYNITLFNELDRIARVIGGYDVGKKGQKVAKEENIKDSGSEHKPGNSALTLPHFIQIAALCFVFSLLPYVYKTVVN